MVGQTLKLLSSDRDMGSRSVSKVAHEGAATGGNIGAVDGKEMPVHGGRSGPDLDQFTKELNVAAADIGRKLHFEVNLQSGKSVIQVIDRETGEVIRQIPPENLYSHLRERGGLGIRLLDVLA